MALRENALRAIGKDIWLGWNAWGIRSKSSAQSAILLFKAFNSTQFLLRYRWFELFIVDKIFIQVDFWGLLAKHFWSEVIEGLKQFFKKIQEAFHKESQLGSCLVQNSHQEP
jgi:hypothetical protein